LAEAIAERGGEIQVVPPTTLDRWWGEAGPLAFEDHAPLAPREGFTGEENPEAGEGDEGDSPPEEDGLF
jgi:hypothetical protein